MVLHNFLLSCEDQWVPDEEESQLIARDLEGAYQRLKDTA